MHAIPLSTIPAIGRRSAARVTIRLLLVSGSGHRPYSPCLCVQPAVFRITRRLRCERPPNQLPVAACLRSCFCRSSLLYSWRCRCVQRTTVLWGDTGDIGITGSPIQLFVRNTAISNNPKLAITCLVSIITSSVGVVWAVLALVGVGAFAPHQTRLDSCQ